MKTKYLKYHLWGKRVAISKIKGICFKIDSRYYNKKKGSKLNNTNNNKLKNEANSNNKVSLVPNNYGKFEEKGFII